MACIVPDIEKIKCPDTQKEVDLSSFDGVEIFLHDCRPIWKTEDSEQLQKAERYYSQLVRDGNATEGDVRAINRVRQQESRKERQTLVGYNLEYRSAKSAVKGLLLDGSFVTVVRVSVAFAEQNRPIQAPESIVIGDTPINLCWWCHFVLMKPIEIEQIFNDQK